MNYNEIITAFKEFIKVRHEDLSQEDHEFFKSSFSKAPIQVLQQIKLILEQLRSKIEITLFKTYYSFIISLIANQEALHGRISPDILEPVTDVNLINPVRSYSSNEVIEITTGTSIWALYLKRQLLEQNRIDQRQIKSAIAIKFFLKKTIWKAEKSAFSLIFEAKIRKKKVGKLFKVLKILYFDRVQNAIFGIQERIKLIERIKKSLGKLFKRINKREEKLERSAVEKMFKYWKKKTSLCFAYFSLSFSKGEQICENDRKTDSASFLIKERSEVIKKKTLGRLGSIIKRIEYSCFLAILLESFEVQNSETVGELETNNKKEVGLEGLKKIIKDHRGRNLKVCFQKFKDFKNHSIRKIKVLKHMTNHLKFKLYTYFIKLFKASKSKACKSSLLELILLSLCKRKMRLNFYSIISFSQFLQKKGFEAFINNFYQNNIESINKTWRWKLSNSETKWQNLLMKSKKDSASSSRLINSLNSYSSSLKVFSFSSLKRTLKTSK